MISISCYHPLKAWYTGETHSSGKPKLNITPYECTYPTIDPAKITVLPHWVEVPCGQCIGCRLERSRQWANRCLLEMQDHPVGTCWFVTLTYDQFHLPWSWYSDDSTGEAIPSQTLCRRDFQLFFKRLRKNTGQKFRYFGCGEYGPSTFRPHGHFNLFGLVLDDLTPLPGRSAQGFTYYNSPTLDRAWSFPCRDEFGNDMDSVRSLAGFVVVTPISWETCAYTARYITKKLTGPLGLYYDYFNIEPPFSMMSLKPGIGRMYYDSHPDLYDFEYINVSTEKGGRKFRPPKYFDRLFDIDHPEESAVMKKDRKRKAELSKKLKLENTDLSYLEYLQVEEDALYDRIKSLRRDLV